MVQFNLSIHGKTHKKFSTESGCCPKASLVQLMRRWKGAWSPVNDMDHSFRIHGHSNSLIQRYTQMEVSWYGGTPRSSISIGFSIINRACVGTPILGNLYMEHCLHTLLRTCTYCNSSQFHPPDFPRNMKEIWKNGILMASTQEVKIQTSRLKKWDRTHLHILYVYICKYAQAAWFAVACKGTFWLSISAMPVSLHCSNWQDLFGQFLWNRLVCTPAKLWGLSSVQGAYEALRLKALVH